MKKLLSVIIALSMIYSLSASAFAVPVDRVWDGSQNTGTWSDGLNWVGNTAPGSSDNAIFNSTGGTVDLIDLSAAKSAGSVYFRLAACDPYTIGVAGIDTLTLGNGGGVAVDLGVINTQTIAAAVNLSPNASFSNNGANDAFLLNVTGNVTGGATDGTLTLNGSDTGNNLISGNILKGAATLGVTKDELGTWILSGTNTYTGTTTVDGGKLIALTNAAALGAGTLTMSGGNLQLVSDASTNFGRNTTVDAALSEIDSGRLTGGAGTTQTLGTLSIGTFTLTTGLGDVSTTSGTQGLTFGAVSLTGDAGITAVNSRTGGGGLLTLGTVNSFDATDRAFTITAAGTADDVTVGAIGGTNDLASVTISGNDISLANIGTAGASGVTGATAVTAATSGADDGSITFTGTTYNTAGTQAYNAGAASNLVNINGGATTFTTTADNVTFTGTTTLADGSNLTVNTAGTAPASGNITMGTIRGTSIEDVTLNANLANVSVGAIGSAGASEIRRVTITGATNTLNGSITTDDDVMNTGNVAITGNVVLGASVTIDTNRVKTSSAGNVTISGATSANAGNLDLTIDTSSSNNYGGNVTLSTLGNAGANYVDDLSITTTSSGVAAGGISLQAVQTDNTQAYNTAGAGGATNGTVTLNGNLTTSNDNITFAANTPVKLGAGVAISTDTGLGTITFGSTLDGTANNAQTLGLTAGTGSIDFDGIVGGTKALGIVTIASAANVTADLAFTAQAINQTAGTGTTTFTGAVQTLGTLATDGLDLNGTAFTISSTVNTGTLGTVSITNSGLLTIAAAGDMTLGGAFLQDGAGLVTTSGDIATTNDAITFTTGVTLADNVALTSGTGKAWLKATLATGGKLLTVNNDDAASAIDGAISGTGGLTKTGTGTLTLGGVNTYSGATNINGGTVQISATTGLGDGVVGNTIGINGGTLRSTANTYSLDADQDITMTGTATIQTDAGTLTLPTGQDIANGAFLLTVAGAGNTTINGVIGNGTGGLTKDGAGTLILGGTNTYTGATTISGGTLKAGKDTQAFGNLSAVTVSAGGTLDLNNYDETLGSLSGAGLVTNSVVTTATLTTGGNDSSTTFSGTIENAAGNKKIKLIKEGTGIFTLSGATNSYSGGTNINNGTLRVGSASALGTGNVANNATLDIGSTTLNIGGTYTQVLGATLMVAINGTSNGSIVATGTADVQTGALLTLAVSSTYIANGATYTIIDGAAGGTVVAPTITTTGSTQATFTATTVGDDLILTASRSSGGFASAATAGDSNASNVGTVLDTITNPSADMSMILNTMSGLSTSQQAAALDTMVPEVDAGILNTTTATLNNFVGASMDRVEEVLTIAKAADSAKTGMSAGDASKVNGIWGKGYGSYLTQGTRNNIAGYDAWNAGTAIGVDHLFADNITLGVSGGYAYGNVDGDVNNASTNINSAQTTIYGGYQDKNLPYFIDAAGSFAYNWYNGQRDINVGGVILRTANAEYGGQQYGVYLGGGYKIDVTKNIEFTPLISLQWNHLRMNSYTETEAAALNLSVASQSYDQLLSGLGARVASPMKFAWGTFTPEAHGKWFYDFIGDPFTVSSNFNGGGASFNSDGCKPALNSFNAGGQLIFDFKNDVSIIGNCDTEMKDEFFGIYGSVTVRYDF